MSLTLALSAALVASASVAQAGPVQTYTNSPVPSRSEGLQTNRLYTPNADPRDDALLNPAPYPSNRTDDPFREQIGRLWVPRSPVGSRTPIIEATRTRNTGAANYGAPPEALDEVIFVKSSIPNVGVIAISPWEKLGAAHIDRIRETNPRLGRKPRPTQFNLEPIGFEPQTARRAKVLLQELRTAQRRWLREQGYILSVRTHINPRLINTPAAKPVSEIEPRGVIRVQPLPKDESRQRAEIDAQTQPTESERVSLPTSPEPYPHTVVVKAEQTDSEQTDG